MERKKIHLLDVAIDSLTWYEALHRAAQFLDQKQFHHIVTPGPEFVLEASANPRFRAVLNRADLSLPDGFGLHIGARLTGQRLQQRIPGVDFVLGLMALAALRSGRVFLFGSKEGIAERAAQRLMNDYPGLIIAGVESGTRGSWTKVSDRRIIERIHQAKPDILLVALGAPKQDLWIDTHRTALHDVSIAIGVGRTFDYLAGAIKRPPTIVRKSGMEWLYTYLAAARFYQPQLRRRRVTNATYRFIIDVLKNRHAAK